MGLLDDLLKTIQEAAAEARRQQEGHVRRPVQRVADEDPVATQQRIQAKAEAAAREKRAEADRLRRAAETRREQQAQADRLAEAQADAGRVRQALRDPASLRDLMVLREILDRPLALRRGRR